ncbi:MAG TPA: arginase, partial [Thermomonas sp.]|nr:arginase [Thermomonas sp.]
MSRNYPPVSVFGVPTDIGASRRGASMGPEALRVAGLLEAIAGRGIDVRDLGDVQGPRNPTSAPVDGYRHLDEVVAWNRAVFEMSTRELQAGRMPIMLGGDHCLGIGAIAAVAAHCRATGKKLRVLWLDAHADFNTRDITPSGNIHGMPVACLCGLGPEPLTSMAGVVPAITPGEVRQIGIRSVDPGEKRLVQEHGLDIYDMRYIDEVGMRRAIEEALDGVDEDTHLHVSFDVDMLDPSIAPGTGTRVPGG